MVQQTGCKPISGGSVDKLRALHTGSTAAPFNSFILGFHVSKGAAWSAKHVLQHSCLPLVLDLDETLLVANSTTQLARKLKDAQSRRWTSLNLSRLYHMRSEFGIALR